MKIFESGSLFHRTCGESEQFPHVLSKLGNARSEARRPFLSITLRKLQQSRPLRCTNVHLELLFLSEERRELQQPHAFPMPKDIIADKGLQEILITSSQTTQTISS